MPTYEFRNNDNGETFTKFMRISAKEEYIKENPNIIQIHTRAAGIVSGVDMNKKVDNGFKEVLSKIAEAHPTSALAAKVGGRSVTKAKVADVAEKHGKTKTGKYSMDL
jgi:hypothetical protein